MNLKSSFRVTIDKGMQVKVGVGQLEFYNEERLVEVPCTAEQLEQLKKELKK